MIFRYEVKFPGVGWRLVDRGYILGNGMLRWENGNGTCGVVESYQFRFTEETINNPIFIALRWWALEEDSRLACLARKVSA